MTEVTLYDLDPQRVMEIVREIKTRGWIQGTDFDFKYHPPKWDTSMFSLEQIERKRAVFIFHTEIYATAFALRYAG